MSGLYRELAPAIVGDGLAVAWTPEPAQRINRVASFNLTIQPGETIEVEFRAPLSGSEPLTEADVLAWFDFWALDLLMSWR